MLEKQFRFDFEHSPNPQPEPILLDSVEGLLGALRHLEYDQSMHFNILDREVQGDLERIRRLTHTRNKEIMTTSFENRTLSQCTGQKVWSVSCHWQPLEDLE